MERVFNVQIINAGASYGSDTRFSIFYVIGGVPDLLNPLATNIPLSELVTGYEVVLEDEITQIMVRATDGVCANTSNVINIPPADFIYEVDCENITKTFTNPGGDFLLTGVPSIIELTVPINRLSGTGSVSVNAPHTFFTTDINNINLADGTHNYIIQVSYNGAFIADATFDLELNIGTETCIIEIPIQQPLDACNVPQSVAINTISGDTGINITITNPIDDVPDYYTIERLFVLDDTPTYVLLTPSAIDGGLPSNALLSFNDTGVDLPNGAEDLFNRIITYKITSYCAEGNTYITQNYIDLKCPVFDVSPNINTVGVFYEHIGGDVNEYVIELRNGLNDTIITSISKAISPSPITHTFSGLTNSTNYVIRVKPRITNAPNGLITINCDQAFSTTNGEEELLCRSINPPEGGGSFINFAGIIGDDLAPQGLKFEALIPFTSAFCIFENNTPIDFIPEGSDGLYRYNGTSTTSVLFAPQITFRVNKSMSLSGFAPADIFVPMEVGIKRGGSLEALTRTIFFNQNVSSVQSPDTLLFNSTIPNNLILNNNDIIGVYFVADLTQFANYINGNWDFDVDIIIEGTYFKIIKK